MKNYTKQDIKNYCRDNNLKVPTFSGNLKVVNCDINTTKPQQLILLEMANHMHVSYRCTFI